MGSPRGHGIYSSNTAYIYFSMEELKRAISKGNTPAPGKDGVSYEMLKRLSDNVLEEILALYNIWEQGKLPSAWKQAVIVPVLKPGKDASQPGSYRPLALTSVLCKVMGRMVTDRLVFKLERNSWFYPAQSG